MFYELHEQYFTILSQFHIIIAYFCLHLFSFQMVKQHLNGSMFLMVLRYQEHILGYYLMIYWL